MKRPNEPNEFYTIRPLPFAPAFFVSLVFVALFISPFAFVIWWAW